MFFNFLSKNKMPQSNNQYSKWRWILTLAGTVFYGLDIVTDVCLAVKYLNEEKYVWSALTVLFVSTGQLVTQIFSYEWFLDDMGQEQTIEGMSKGWLVVLHISGGGTIMRHWLLLKEGFIQVWRRTNSDTNEQMSKYQKMLCMATDLTMLKVFEVFLESAPQLLLQLYIWQHHDVGSSMQYASLVFSFCNMAWALVDYRRCLRRSVPGYRKMPLPLPTIVYLLYKLFTLTSHVLSFSLFLTFSSLYTTIVLGFLWLMACIWTNCLQTNFCTSKKLEYLYRVVVGFILLFTFFNVKGKDTKIEMILYYSFYSIISITAPTLKIFLQPELETRSIVLIILIFATLLLGLMFLVLYYHYLHPKGAEPRQPDEVDGMGSDAEITLTFKKVRDFLQP